MNRLKKILLIFFTGLALFSSLNIYASNFVCGQDLDGNGDVAGVGETTSCSTIGGEQFCSIGAQSCNVNTTVEYTCGLNNNNKYSNENICKNNCFSNELATIRWTVPGDYYWTVPDGITQVNVSVKGGGGGGGGGGMGHPRFGGRKAGPGFSGHVSAFGTITSNGGNGGAGGSYFGGGEAGNDGILVVNNNFSISTNVILITIGNGGEGGVKRKFSQSWKGTPPTNNATGAGGSGGAYRAVGRGGDSGYVSIGFNQSVQQNCSPTTETTYTCPTAGNACVSVGGVQQCSPNQCVDLDVTPPIETQPPSTSVVDDGERNAEGACLDQALMFTGRNLSCKKSGFTKDCCKDTGIVYNDSSGSVLSNSARSVAISQAYEAIKTAYLTYQATASASIAVESAQAAFVGVDPYSIAISIAIQVVTKFISCGQEDTEAAMLKGSGYCHLVGTYCSKKWPLVGCVARSESHCCFNSKLARIIQEQGRVQMGRSWGTAESPQCGGFSPSEFQALDFSRIDMSEYYDDIKSESSSLIQENITNSLENYYEQIRP